MNKKERTSVFSVIIIIAVFYGLINSLDSISQSVIDFIDSFGSALLVLFLIYAAYRLIRK